MAVSENKPPVKKNYLVPLRQLLLAVHEEIPALANKQLLTEFNWQQVGITVPYIIFFTGRCGSTWLASLLKSTKLVGNPEEFFNADIARCYPSYNTAGLENYFTRIVLREQSNQRFGIEIDAERLRAIHETIAIKNLFTSPAAVVFYMYRRDILGQAWSWARARKSGIWHIGIEQTDMPRTEAVPSIKEIAVELVRIKRNEEFLQRFFTQNNLKPIHIEYESLVTDPVATLYSLLVNLGITKAQIQAIKLEAGKTKQLDYTEKHRVLLEFHAQYFEVLNDLSRNRQRFSSFELEKLLQ